MVSLKYSRHLLCITGILIVSCITFALYVYKNHLSTTLLPHAEQRLLTITEKRIKDVEDFINIQQKQFNDFSHNNQIHQAFADVAKVTTPSFSLFIKTYLETNDGLNIVLIRPDGSVIFSANNSKDFNVNLTAMSYDKSNLGQSYKQTLLTLTPTFSNLTYDLFTKQPSLYLVVPVFKNKIVLGFIALQLNHQKIYAITQNYFDLGATGEVFLASLSGNKVQIISPTRHFKNAAFEISEYILDTPLSFKAKAVLGHKGSGIAPDYRNVECVGGWGYLPALAWGIVVKMDVQEALWFVALLNYIIFALICLLLILVSIYFFHFKNTFTDSIKHFWKSHITTYIPIRKTIIALLVLSIFAIGALGYIHYYSLDKQTLQQAQSEAQIKLEDTHWKITNEIEKVMLRTQSIADDLSSGRLKKEDIIIRMNRELRENPCIFGITVAYEPYAYDAQRKLYAPHTTQHNKVITTHYIDTLYDYTQPESLDFGEADWYKQSINKKSLWFEPTKETVHKKIVAEYSTPFFAVGDLNNEKSNGVIVAEYDLECMSAAVQKLIIGETGYAFITTENGRFLYHPNKTFVDDKKTILDLAQTFISKDLKNIAEIIQTSGQGAFMYIDPGTNEPVWINFTTIPHVQWKLGIIFPETEISPSQETTRHIIIWVLIVIILLLVFLAFIASSVTLENIASLRRFSIITSIIFLTALFILFLLIQRTKPSMIDKNDVILNNETTLQAFLIEEQQKITSRYESLTLIPTGITVYSIAFPDTEHVSFTASIWQKYKIDDTTTERSLRFPEATDVTITKEFERTENNMQIISWKVTATLQQYYNHTKYPFDQRTIKIPLRPHMSSNSNVLCIPAFTDYQNVQDQQKLGISEQLNVPDFNIQQTFFDLNSELKTTNSGNSQQQTRQNEITLQFNIALQRNLINVLIVYIVPILVILFSLYAIFIKTADIFLNPKEAVSSLIGPYTGLLFALILLHGSLRSNYKTGGFLFVESLFFFAYVTLLVFILHALFARRSKNKDFTNYLTVLLKLFFWPVQFACWFIVTAIVFYN